MRSNANCSDASLERLHSVSVKCVISPRDAVGLESPLTYMLIFRVMCVLHTRTCTPLLASTTLCQSSVVRMRLLLFKSFFVFLTSARQEHDVEMVRRSSSLNDHWQSNPPCWILRTGLCDAERPWNLPPEYLYSRWWCRCTHQHHQHI